MPWKKHPFVDLLDLSICPNINDQCYLLAYVTFYSMLCKNMTNDLLHHRNINTTCVVHVQVGKIKFLINEALSLSQPIIYEGQDKNPEMCRVLLTHEIMCRLVPSFCQLLIVTSNLASAFSAQMYLYLWKGETFIRL